MKEGLALIAVRQVLFKGPGFTMTFRRIVWTN